MSQRFAVSFEVELEDEMVEENRLTPDTMQYDVFDVVSDSLVEPSRLHNVKVVAL